jgi:hypothetical protein
MSFKVKVTDEEVMGWTKRLLITDEDNNEFRCTLYWADGNGYDLTWWNGEPDWASEWDENDHDGMYIEWWLDEESCK